MNSFDTWMPELVLSDGGRLAAGFPPSKVGDCLTRAIAHATGLPYGPIWYKLAFAKCSHTGRVYGTADDGCSPDDIAGYLIELGFVRLQPLGALARRASELPWLATGRYLINTPRHMAACVNGKWLDTWDSRDCYIERVYELIH